MAWLKISFGASTLSRASVNQKHITPAAFPPGKPWSEQDFIDLALDTGTQFDPGQRWAYANLGYLFVKRIFEEVAGVSVQQLLETAASNPLRLNQTFFTSTLCYTKWLMP